MSKLKQAHQNLREQIARVVVGQDEVIDQLMISIFARGHCILEGVPGLAKTLMVSTLADCLALDFTRIQFTPDLMPSDITGTEVLQEDRATGARQLRYVRGPVFTNVLLADEINRTPPKTQAALLEAMQERQVSAGGHRHALPDPFFVLATQNPIEQEGTYPLARGPVGPLLVQGVRRLSDAGRRAADLSRDDRRGAQGTDQGALGRGDSRVAGAGAARAGLGSLPGLCDGPGARHADRPRSDKPAYIDKWIAWGAGPRAGQALVLAAKARTALDGRTCVTIEDIRAVAHPGVAPSAGDDLRRAGRRPNARHRDRRACCSDIPVRPGVDASRWPRRPSFPILKSWRASPG